MINKISTYACNPDNSRGRLYPEEECSTRSVYQRDRDRVIHSAAFRRLEYKTQVFVNHEGDHYRTRLTHSLEVAQLARSMSRHLLLNEDLAEVIALSHDIGHTPFGHAGEDALKEAMEEYGGFDHNTQAIRVLTQLEHRYAEFDGLNLTWESLEGIIKHNGPIVKGKKLYYSILQGKSDVTDEIPYRLLTYLRKHDLEAYNHASAEAQIAAVADDIAYNNHDLEDGIRAKLFTIDELTTVPLIAEITKYVDKKYPNIDEKRRTHEIIRRIINRLVVDVVQQFQSNLEKFNIHTTDDIRNLRRQIVHFSPEIEESNRILKEFLKQHMYRFYKVNRMTSKARKIVRRLFNFFQKEPECLPTEWYNKAKNANERELAILVSDFIAGMTDRFAIDEYRRIFDIYSTHTR